MNVLSLFDGISCGQLALQRVGIKPTVYYASEIDESAIAITQRNFPTTVQLGNVTNVSGMVRSNLIRTGGVDLLIGGSPCQGFSNLGKNLGFADPRSKLVIEFINIKAALNPRWFLLENVKMPKQDCDMISMLLGCKPVEIDSALFSAQSRKRLYWTNIPIAPIVDRKIMFWAIREYRMVDEYKVNNTASRRRMWSNGIGGKNNNGICPNITYAEKTYCLTIKQDRSPNAGLIQYQDFCRYLTHIECERLQTLPDNYTLGASRVDRYKHLGNCWTVDVIAHILRGIIA